jgi:hypothetical protein
MQILVFGEDANDQTTVIELLRGLRPDLGVKYSPVKTPISLVRGMRPESAKSRNERILAAIRAANVRLPVHATLLHEDADDVEPAHLALIRAKEQPLIAAPGTVVAVVPAWEMETSWLMFPEAVASLHASWEKPDKYVNRNVGLVRHAKQELAKLIRPSGHRGRFRDYAESESVAIAKAVVMRGELGTPKAHSASWQAFVARVAAL